jgi:glutaredoxin
MSVTIYTSEHCGPCCQLKKYLKYKGIAFIDKDIEEPENRAAVKDLSGQCIVPVSVIDDNVVVGYNLHRINSLLGIN